MAEEHTGDCSMYRYQDGQKIYENDVMIGDIVCCGHGCYKVVDKIPTDDGYWELDLEPVKTH